MEESYTINPGISDFLTKGDFLSSFLTGKENNMLKTISCFKAIVISSILLAGTTLAADNSWPNDKPTFTEKPLYVAGMDNVNIYRIPSTITTQKGTLLAFCEAREGGDKSPTDLVLKHSFNRGKNWTKMQVVYPGKGGAIMNPTPVVDRRDGTIVLVCNLINRSKRLDTIRVLTSKDDGLTWAEVLSYAAKHKIKFYWTPTNASWLNRIESHFTALRKFALDNTDYRSHEEQQEAIECYLSWRNRTRGISLEDWKSYRSAWKRVA